jgi:hypothetical protein
MTSWWGYVVMPVHFHLLISNLPRKNVGWLGRNGINREGEGAEDRKGKNRTG